MRALTLTAFTGPGGLELADVPEPDAGDDILIDVRAAGVCFPDLLLSQDRYQVKVELPYIPGQEVAGVVLSAPSDSGFVAGDRVWAGLANGGGFAEQVAVTSGLVHRLPDVLDFAEGAALGVNFMTAAFAFRMRCPLAAGDQVLVLGAAGGLGTAVVSVARHLGARVIAQVSSEAKAVIARQAGADEVIVGTAFREPLAELAPGGVEVVADIVGGDATLDAIRCCAPGGRVLILGFVAGDIPKIGTNRLLLRNVSLVGAGLGAMEQARPGSLIAIEAELEAMLQDGVRPVVGARYPLAEGAAALRALESREALAKIVLDL